MSPLVLHLFFCVNDSATTGIYTLSLHDALPISAWARRAGTRPGRAGRGRGRGTERAKASVAIIPPWPRPGVRSEEHTSELQSHSDLVCRLLLEKKKTNIL